MKSALLASACALVVISSAPALAQQEPSTQPLDAADVADPGVTGQNEEGADAAQVDVVPSPRAQADTIVITAQGREQQLSDVPISVSAVSAEQLQNSGANDIRELNQVAPSLLVSSTGNEANGSARIRGIGTVGDNPGLESSVAVFVDGVYRSRSGAALNEIGPVDRVEVLRGPQGTLFGRNASAGLINIVTAAPEFDFGAYGAGTYGNYDFYRLEGGVTGPLTDTIAARIDGVYSKRDGFYDDVVNDTTVNNRDRYLVRGQVAFEPTEDLQFRLIGDYSKKDEACCAAVFIDGGTPGANIPLSGDAANPQGYGDPLISAANPIIPVLLDLGQDPRAFTDDMYDRNIYPTAGRSYEGKTEDWGASLQADWNLGGIELTSITGYREYLNQQGGDTDYTTVDILYREPGPDAGSRKFETFSQELRLQGSLFDDRLDWLVGGYFANEDLTVRDNLKFGTEYGRFATCRVSRTSLAPLFAGSPLAGIYDPTAAGCLNPALAPALAAPGISPFGADGAAIVAGFNRLDSVNDVGSNGSRYMQNSKNFAVFTHNIIHVTDTVDLTLGLRYTNETKKLDTEFNNTNTICPVQREALLPLTQSANPLTSGIAAGLISLSCQGNSTSELNGLDVSDKRDESEFTGTAVLSWKPTPDLMTYASYSRGYKAGGFNLDRSALNGQAANAVVLGPLALADPANLQFDQEEVDAYEIGAKYAARGMSFSVAAFRQEFSNFQLNTFNRTVFLVQNINGCDELDGGDDADTDASAATGACAGDTEPGVISQGVELEASINPADYLNLTAALTYADTTYEDNLVGNDSGIALDPALRLLPGDNLSNAPETVVTSSVSWAPPIGNSGLSGLFYLNARVTSDYNTGSDLLPAKEQDGFVLVNGRIGIRGPEEAWAVELWGQNLFNEDYTQVGFNTPFIAPNQTYSAFLAEPRTYGVTVRGRF
ncbi:TonB-dependent receptor [Pacificimonas flava]|uniref:TonB-dependent receptor n=1 Tax=Pacificimonas flava TaxID=1234595 RepID=M2T8D0_9SPHN|nr:TonB-dependent receptor [Pacificimonas flava]EMD82774.1 TonB-dependent receptor [Pacificimonas flava]MBB5279390.1 outer membrane receptor protein involved in Fe transport [Pacificimonas flava]